VKLRNTLIGIPSEDVWLDGLLAHAPDVRGLAVLLQPDAADPAHARESALAHELQRHGYATLTLNLLTRYEQTRDPDARYNVPLLSARVHAAAEWVGHQPPLGMLAVGLIASDTPCAAAIRAAVKDPERFGAIVCLGGRADLAGSAQLRALRVPTRFVVGTADAHAGTLRQAHALLGGEHDWQDAHGADLLHVTDSQTAAIGELVAQWLDRHLRAPAAPAEAHATAGTDATVPQYDDPAPHQT